MTIDDCESLESDSDFICKLVQAKMPFGKYRGLRLLDLPEAYVLWLREKGFPSGKLGDQLATVYEIKLNGLEYLFKDPTKFGP